MEGFEGKIILQGHFGLQYFLIFAFMARVCDSSEMMSFHFEILGVGGRKWKAAAAW